MKILSVLVGLLLVLVITDHRAEAQVSRYQVVSVGTPTEAILVDTVLGCTWHLAQDPRSHRLYFHFLPRTGFPPGQSITAAMIPKECAGLDGLIPTDFLQPREPERKPQ